MLKKLFGLDNKDNKSIDMPTADGKDILTSPASGTVVSLSEVPDPTFSKKMMGDGVAIKPSKGVIVSPVHGEVMQIFPTKHAVGLKTVNGVEILIHIGIETVNMQGEGFKSYAKEGDKVAKGDKLIEFDMDLVNEKADSTITPIIITNGEIVTNIDKQENIEVVAGETIIMTVMSK